jgi:hypothetical protein
VVLVTLLTVALLTDGTGGGGDSICHYLIARYSWKHPELFLDHWGKPVYTMLFSTPAQLGFKAVKIANIIVTVLACYFSFKIAKNLQIKNVVWLVPFYFLAPEVIEVTLSGLTEPLFALTLILGIHFIIKGQKNVGTIILSFLPFVRSEGLVILCVILVYFLFIKNYKGLPWILFGHIFMGIMGVFLYHDIFWVFNKLPYARLDSVYGHGYWNYFWEQMYFIIGPILFVLLQIGYLGIILTNIKALSIRIKERLFIDKVFLVYGIFIVFFIAHSLFWTLGIFGSLGLTRVFIGVMPLIAIICLDGLNYIFSIIDAFVLPKFRQVFTILVFCGLLFFCFISKPTAIEYKNNIVLNEEQKLIAHDIYPYVKNKFPNYTLYFSDVGVSYFFGVDMFGEDGSHRIKDTKYLNFSASNGLIIWDSWFSQNEEKISRDSLLNNPNLKLDTMFSTAHHIDYLLFVKR